MTWFLLPIFLLQTALIVYAVYFFVRKFYSQSLLRQEEFNRVQRELLRADAQNSLRYVEDQQRANLEQITHLRGVVESLRQHVEGNLSQFRQEQNQRMGEMKLIVEEKLHATLEQRLSSSFRQVGERLEKVNLGLGEMQRLAGEVGQLQKTLLNVCSRGVLGEVQLERILGDFLTSAQFMKNVPIKKATFVDFAVKLPSKYQDEEDILLPIDAKFPTEDYQQLMEAYESSDSVRILACRKQLQDRIKTFAKDIQSKYIDPPKTTDFALLFLPTEGLYSEFLRMAGVTETLQRDYRVVVVGPSTVAALLNSLQVGFRCLAVEKRTQDVAKLLAVVKSDFHKFGDLLDKTQKKLDEASHHLGDASARSRHIERKLVNVQALPEAAEDSLSLL